EPAIESQLTGSYVYHARTALCFGRVTGGARRRLKVSIRHLMSTRAADKDRVGRVGDRKDPGVGISTSSPPRKIGWPLSVTTRIGSPVAIKLLKHASGSRI